MYDRSNLVITCCDSAQLRPRQPYRLL